MSLVFKKTCYLCGAKVNRLYDGICVNCLKGEVNPVKEIKDTNFKVCNMCKRIHYENQLIIPEKLEGMMPSIVKSRIEMNKGYVLNDVKISNFEIDGHKVCFEMEIDYDILK